MDDSVYKQIMSLPSGSGLTVYYRHGGPSNYRIVDAKGKKQLRSMLTGRARTFATVSELKRALGQPIGVRVMDQGGEERWMLRP